MSRPAVHDAGEMLDAALALLREGGPRAVTMTAVAAATGAPSGSVYQRFPSRDALLASLWMRTVEDFQAGFLAALEGSTRARDVREEDAAAPAEAALRAIRWALKWVRSDPDSARLLLLYRREDLVSSEWPAEIVWRAAALAERFDEAVRAFATHLEGKDALARAWFVLADLPTAGVRRHLANGQPVPRSVDHVLAQTVQSLLGSPGGR